MTCLVMMKSCFFVLTGRTKNIKMFAGKLLLKYLKMEELVCANIKISKTAIHKVGSFEAKL